MMKLVKGSLTDCGQHGYSLSFLTGQSNKCKKNLHLLAVKILPVLKWQILITVEYLLTYRVA